MKSMQTPEQNQNEFEIRVEDLKKKLPIKFTIDNVELTLQLGNPEKKVSSENTYRANLEVINPDQEIVGVMDGQLVLENDGLFMYCDAMSRDMASSELKGVIRKAIVELLKVGAVTAWENSTQLTKGRNSGESMYQNLETNQQEYGIIVTVNRDPTNHDRSRYHIEKK
ncbi:MAG: hypothetical protein ABI425_04760 [Patescibacteria group bacterium]